MLGLDYSLSKPDPAYIKSQGFDFVMRYLSYSPGKNIDAAEAQAHLAAGLSIGLVWETYANRPLSGYSGGASDAQAAYAQAQAVGQPTNRPIYFAVDWDASSDELAVIDDYLRGAASVLGAHRIGVYGSYDVVRHCLESGTAVYGWQTYAWSGGRVYEGCHVYQYSNGEWNDSVDFNEAKQSDFGQWPGGSTQEANVAIIPHGDIGAHFQQLGDAGFCMGVALTEEHPANNYAGVEVGKFQQFQRGLIFWSNKTRVCGEVHGEILGRYGAVGGGEGFLGLPTSDEKDVPGITGAKMNTFQGGNIYWSAATKAHEMHGAILAKYLALGPDACGLPTTDETAVPGGAPGRKSELVGATIYWSTASGANEVHGEIRNKWLAAGGPTGFMGLPASDEQNVASVTGGKRNQFQYANIYWSAATKAIEVHGAILAKYLEVGGPEKLGLPTLDEYDYHGDRRSDFQKGYIQWNRQAGARVNP